MMATVKSNIRRMIMNREIRTDLAIELRESAGGNTEMEGVRVKTVVNAVSYTHLTLPTNSRA